MFVKRDDGLDRVFIPFDVGALVLAVLFTVISRVRGLLVVPVFIGWWLASFLALMLLYYVIVWLISLTVDIEAPPPMENHPFARRIVIQVIGHLNRFARIRIHLSGSEKIPEGRFLLVSNHRSSYDPITTVWALRKYDIGFITKPENHRIPLAGPMIYRANYLPIDRENPRRALETINAAAQLLENDVVSIGVYPEGTRNRSGDMIPFHNGVFKIAIRAKVPIVVVSVRGTERIGDNFPLRPTDVYLNVCAVLPPEELKTSNAAVADRVRGILEQELAPEESAAR